LVTRFARDFSGWQNVETTVWLVVAAWLNLSLARYGAAPLLGLGHPFLHFGNPERQIRRFDCAQLQVQKGREASRDFRRKLSGENVSDQPGHGVPNCHRIIQCGQWISILCDNTTIFLAPNPAQFRGFIGIGVKETQAACGRGCSAGLARFCQATTAIPLIPDRHFF